MGRILVASSNVFRRRDLVVGLEVERHSVAETGTVRQTIDAVQSGSHHVVILDSKLESSDQPDICRGIRAVANLGIIALIGDLSASECAAALNAGADDYLPQRFMFAELSARVRAILRRLGADRVHDNQIPLADRTVDLRAHKVRGPGEAIANLTPREFDVLKFLVDRGGEPVAIRDLARQVWQRDGTGDLEYVRVVISQLRGKLERDRNRPAHILTERAGGYRFQSSSLDFMPASSRKNDIPAMVL